MPRDDLPHPPPLPKMPSGYQIMASSRQSQPEKEQDSSLREVADLLRQLVELLSSKTEPPKRDEGQEGVRFTEHPEQAVDQTVVASYSPDERRALEMTPPGGELPAQPAGGLVMPTWEQVIEQGQEGIRQATAGLAMGGGDGGERERVEPPPPVIGSEPKPQASADPLVEAIDRLIDKIGTIDPTSPRDPNDEILKALDRIYDALTSGGGMVLG